VKVFSFALDLATFGVAIKVSNGPPQRIQGHHFVRVCFNEGESEICGGSGLHVDDAEFSSIVMWFCHGARPAPLHQGVVLRKPGYLSLKFL